MMVGVRVRNPWEPTIGLKVRDRGERRFPKGKLLDNHSVLCIWLVLNSVGRMDLWIYGWLPKPFRAPRSLLTPPSDEGHPLTLALWRQPFSPSRFSIFHSPPPNFASLKCVLLLQKSTKRDLGNMMPIPHSGQDRHQKPKSSQEV